MSELSKYEIVLNELMSLEVQVSSLIEKYELLQKHKKELELKISGLKKENELLIMKLATIENENRDLLSGKPGQFSGIKLSDSEKESVRNRISDLINRIDYHIKSS